MKYPTPRQYEQFHLYYESLGNHMIGDRERINKLSDLVYSEGYEEAYQEWKNKFPLGINDRCPEPDDADENGFLQVLDDRGYWEPETYNFVYGNYLLNPRVWTHTPIWKPKSDEDKINDAISILEGKSTASLKVLEVQTVLSALEIAKRNITPAS